MATCEWCWREANKRNDPYGYLLDKYQDILTEQEEMGRLADCPEAREKHNHLEEEIEMKIIGWYCQDCETMSLDCNICCRQLNQVPLVFLHDVKQWLQKEREEGMFRAGGESSSVGWWLKDMIKRLRM